MILAQHHEYPTTRYPRYHGDHSGDHNHDQHLVSNGDLSGDHYHDQHLVSNIIINILPICTAQNINIYIYITYKSFRHVSVDRTVGPSTDATIDRLNTLCRGSTLYPHHGTHGLALPFGWTNGIPTKPIYCHDTLPATPTRSQLG